MGPPKFRATCAKFGIEIDEDMAVQVVGAYRAKFHRVKQMWWDQEAAAIRATLNHFESEPVRCGYVTWEYQEPFLFCTLPSGRRLAYPFPEVRERATPWG